ncbi:MAG: hypothetical protein WCW35_11305 [Bacteroidota bacterium]
MNRTKAILLFCVLARYCEPLISQSNDIPDDTSKFSDEFVLVRHPKFVENCNNVTQTNGVLIFPSRNPQLNSGAQYTIVTHMGECVSALVKNILLDDSCLLYSGLDISFGLFDAKKVLSWDNDIDAMVAVKSSSINGCKTGKVSTFYRKNTLTESLSLIKSFIPDSEEVEVSRSLSIITPDNREYYFLGINQYAKSNQYQAGDAAMLPIGFLFYLDHGKPQLLHREKYLTNIFTISDLNDDDEYEILVYCGSYAGGNYELRTFDGKTILKKKYLYGWDD